MKKTTIVLVIKWYNNDWGGDRRPVTIDYETTEELNTKKSLILNEFRTKPMDIDYLKEGYNIGKIPYSVNLL